MASAFKKPSTARFEPYFSTLKSNENKYWDQLMFPVTAKESGAVSYIDFAPDKCNMFAVSSSTKIEIYSTVTCEVIKTVAGSYGTVYGGSFRRDGNLLVAGSEEGKVKVFNLDSNCVLRHFTGHTSAVRQCKFTRDNVHVVSFSDDKNVVVWDLPGEVPVLTYKEHSDYVRTGAVSTSDGNLFISGSYDHKVKMFDSRTSTSVLSVDHGAPVESVLLFPSSSVMVSAGGLVVKVWDVHGGGRLLTKVSGHHKTVTCLSFAKGHQRLLTGSLDKHIKIYDVNTYRELHTLNFPSPIISVGNAEGDETLAVGMSDGLLSIQNRNQPCGAKEETAVRPRRKRSSNLKKKVKASPYDYLRHFEATKALSSVLERHMNNEPEVAMTVIQELMRRGSITAAVAGRNQYSLAIVLNFINRHISNPLFTALIVDFANIVLDVYGAELLKTKTLTGLFKKTKMHVQREIEGMKTMMALNGAIEMLLATANGSNRSRLTVEELPATSISDRAMIVD